MSPIDSSINHMNFSSLYIHGMYDMQETPTHDNAEKLPDLEPEIKTKNRIFRIIDGSVENRTSILSKPHPIVPIAIFTMHDMLSGVTDNITISQRHAP
jgi:hypothetical protein